MIRALIFDLDDTLYRERDFVAGGFRAAALRLSAGCSWTPQDIHGFMMRTLDKEGRRRVFPAALERFPGTGLSLDDLVSAYRGHAPDIRLFQGYRELLNELRGRYRLGLITDGNPEMQRTKCRALRLDDCIDEMIFTWDYGWEKQKPHPFSFLLMLDRLRVTATQAMFIGDSVEKDCLGARSAGLKSIRIRNESAGSAARQEADADIVIDSLIQLPFIMTLFGGQNEAA